MVFIKYTKIIKIVGKLKILSISILYYINYTILDSKWKLFNS